jgi:hypothetical protein
VVLGEPAILQPAYSDSGIPIPVSYRKELLRIGS